MSNWRSLTDLGLAHGSWPDYEERIRRFAAHKPGWTIKNWNRDLARSSQADAKGMHSAGRKVESQEVTAGATPHVAGCEANWPDASAPFKSWSNKKISGDHIQPLWGEETSNPYRGYVTYLTTKSRRTLVHPNAVLSMMKQLPKGASWTGVRRTRGCETTVDNLGLMTTLWIRIWTFILSREM